MGFDVDEQPGASWFEAGMNCLHHFGWVCHVVNAVERSDEVERVVGGEWVAAGVVEKCVRKFCVAQFLCCAV